MFLSLSHITGHKRINGLLLSDSQFLFVPLHKICYNNVDLKCDSGMK